MNDYKTRKSDRFQSEDREEWLIKLIKRYDLYGDIEDSYFLVRYLISIVNLTVL